MQAEGVHRLGSVQAEGVCKQCVQAGECERRGDGDASRGSVLAEGVCRGSYTQTCKSAHGDKDGLGPLVVSGQHLEFHED